MVQSDHGDNRALVFFGEVRDRVLGKGIPSDKNRKKRIEMKKKE
jgi:hypothetical protein